MKNYNPISVNLHFWPYCNLNCKYCFVHFSDISTTLAKDQWLDIIEELWNYNFRKLNFAGGEPTLCPFLDELLKFARDIGFTTSLISNGTGIDDSMIDSYIMVGPSGRFFQNSGKRYHFSESILKVGVANALSEIHYNHHKFLKRDGLYSWS